MFYRTGTYVAFHAAGTSDPTESDMKYYRTLQMWDVRPDHAFEFTNSHEKTAAVRDSSERETLKRRLIERLNRSKNMILIIGATTRHDTDWVPFEISYAIDRCRIPIIAAYPGYINITAPAALAYLWPPALAARIWNGTAHVIHVPFKQRPLADAVAQFNHRNYPPGGGLGVYSLQAYRQWGLLWTPSRAVSLPWGRRPPLARPPQQPAFGGLFASLLASAQAPPRLPPPRPRPVTSSAGDSEPLLTLLRLLRGKPGM